MRYNRRSGRVHQDSYRISDSFKESWREYRLIQKCEQAVL